MEIFAAGSNLVTFGDGWHDQLEGDPTSPHRWTVGLDASIRVPKITSNPLMRGALQIELDAVPYLPPNSVPYQDVLLFVDGTMASAIRLHDGDVKRLETDYPFPSAQTPFSNIRFYLPQSAKPSFFGDGTDQRQLGIGLKSLKLTFLEGF